MRRVALGLLLPIAIFAPFAISQTTPTLRTRGQADQSTPAHVAKGFSTLPEDASGEYELDDRGSVIQITIEHDGLTGYITKMDQGTALTLAFDRTSFAGDRVCFTTKTVHGLRYSFTGVIARGDAQDRSQSGFYRLSGNLSTYLNARSATRRVSLQSTPRNR